MAIVTFSRHLVLCPSHQHRHRFMETLEQELAEMNYQENVLLAAMAVAAITGAVLVTASTSMVKSAVPGKMRRLSIDPPVYPLLRSEETSLQ